MNKSYEDLIQRATQIKNETGAEQNSHGRVGSLMEDMIDSNHSSITSLDGRVTTAENQISTIIAGGGGGGGTSGQQRTYFLNIAHGTVPVLPSTNDYKRSGDYFEIDGSGQQWTFTNTNPGPNQDTYMMWSWFVGNVPTSISGPVRVYDSSTSGGSNGKDSAEIEWIYWRNTSTVDWTSPEYAQVVTDLNNYNGTTKISGSANIGGLTWTDHPSGISSTYMYEYASFRTSGYAADGKTRVWGQPNGFSAPILWSAYGDKGTDGDGVEYIFYANAGSSIPAGDDYDPTTWTNDEGFQEPEYIRESSGGTKYWSDNPINLYTLGQGAVEWVSMRKQQDGVWQAYSTPAVWSRLAVDGVISGYITDLSNENMPVGTTYAGFANNYENTCDVNVYDESGALTYGTDYTISIGTITRSDGVAVGGHISATNVINSVAGKTVKVSIDNDGVSDFASKNAFIPITVTINTGLNQTTTRNLTITLFGVAVGEAGKVIELFTETSAIHVNAERNAIIPSDLAVGMRIGIGSDYQIKTAPNLGTGFTIEYYYGWDTGSSTNRSTLNSGSISPALTYNDGSTTHTCSSLYIVLKKDGYRIDEERIPYIVDGISISKVETFYHAATISNPAQIIDGSELYPNPSAFSNYWKTTIQAAGWNATNKYLYMQERNTYSDGTVDFGAISLFRTWINDGTNGSTIWQAQAFKAFTGNPTDRPSAASVTATTVSFGNGWNSTPPVIAEKGLSSIDLSSMYSWQAGPNAVTIPSPGDGYVNYGIIRFTTFGTNVVIDIEISASTEADFDFGAIGKLDDDSIYEDLLSDSRVDVAKAIKEDDGSYLSAKASGLDTVTVSLTVASPGQHYIYVLYAKDQSTSSHNDEVTFLVTSEIVAQGRIYYSTARVVDGTVQIPAGKQTGWSDPVLWDGKTGATGGNGYSLVVNPPQFMVNEIYNEDEIPSYEFTDVIISIKSGNVPQNLYFQTASPNSGVPCYTSNGGTTNIISATASLEEPSTQVKIHITSVNSSNTAVTEGYMLITVGVDANPTPYAQTIKIPFYISRMERELFAVKEDLTQYIEDQGYVTETYYTAGITATEKKLRSEYTEQISKAGDYGTNLFGFHKGITFGREISGYSNAVIPFIQGYGFVISSTPSGIYNLGFDGVGGLFTVSFYVKKSTSGQIYLFFDLCDVVPQTIMVNDVGGYSAETGVPVNDSWKKVVLMFELSDAEAARGAINGFFDIQRHDTDTSNPIYIRHLMIERGNRINNFCEADEDIAYLGSLVRDSWTLNTSQAEETTDYQAPEQGLKVYKNTVYPASGDAVNCFSYASVSLTSGKIYTLSFYAKATSGSPADNKLMISLENSNDVAITDGYIDKFKAADNYITSSNNDGSYIEEANYFVGTNGDCKVRLTTSWRKYYVHFYCQNSVTASLNPFRILYGDITSGAYFLVSDVKFEEGYVMDTTYFSSLIEQTARRLSLVQQTGLTKAGIDIQKGIVNLYGDRVVFSDASGSITDKIWIDPTYGTLHAVNGDFSGKIHAVEGDFTDITSQDGHVGIVGTPTQSYDSWQSKTVYWRGLAIGEDPVNGTNDLATIGGRFDAADKVTGYGYIALARNRVVNNVATGSEVTVNLRAHDGEIYCKKINAEIVKTTTATTNSTSYQADGTVSKILCNRSGNQTVTLPANIGLEQIEVWVRKTGTGTVTVKDVGSSSIGTVTESDGWKLFVYVSGTGWC